jgi:hypothetical protein
MFIYLTPILDLQNVSVWAEEDDVEVEFAIADAIASNCRSLVNYDLKEFPLKRSDIEALTSLPRLKSLEIDGFYAVIDELSSLSLLKGLKHLGVNWQEELADVLPIIG